MRILLLHSDFLKVRVKKRAIKNAEEIGKKEYSIGESLVVFISAEKGDEKKENLIEKVVDSIIDVVNRIGLETGTVVLYPYVHLTSNPAKPDLAFKLILEIEKELKNRQINVVRIPFGWYKEFEIKVKGHPLSELSRSF